MIIYKVTNLISGNMYIGKSVKSLEERKYQHLLNSKYGKSKFHKALKSYGVDSFIWEVIDTAETKDELNQKEISYIKKYDTISNGYNLVDGGTGGYNKYAVEANKKRKGLKYENFMNPIHIDRVKTMHSMNAKEHNKIYGFDVIDKDIQREWAKLGNKVRTENGYRHSEETIQKIKNSNKGKEVSDETKKLISERTKEAMSKLDRDELQRKATIGRARYWEKKHKDDRNRLLELKSKGLNVKSIIAKMDISYPTYYARLDELKKMGKL